MRGERMYGYEAPDVSNREGVWRPVPEDEAREAVIAAAQLEHDRGNVSDTSPLGRALTRLGALDAS